MPSIVYIFVGPVNQENYRGRITLNGRDGGITTETFVPTKFIYEDETGTYF